MVGLRDKRRDVVVVKDKIERIEKGIEKLEKRRIEPGENITIQENGDVLKINAEGGKLDDGVMAFLARLSEFIETPLEIVGGKGVVVQKTHSGWRISATASDDDSIAEKKNKSKVDDYPFIVKIIPDNEVEEELGTTGKNIGHVGLRIGSLNVPNRIIAGMELLEMEPRVMFSGSGYICLTLSYNRELKKYDISVRSEKNIPAENVNLYVVLLARIIEETEGDIKKLSVVQMHFGEIRVTGRLV